MKRVPAASCGADGVRRCRCGQGGRTGTRVRAHPGRGECFAVLRTVISSTKSRTESTRVLRRTNERSLPISQSMEVYSEAPTQRRTALNPDLICLLLK
jgi:hypothetical protein